MHADRMTCCSIHIPVVTVGLGGTDRIMGGPHTDVLGVEARVMLATRGLLALLGGPELLNDFAEPGEW